MRFVITATPRAATRYAATLMQALNVPCVHERVFRPDRPLVDVLSWYQAADRGESSWAAWTFLGSLPGPVVVLHQHRDPWRVIDSLAHRNSIIKLDAPDTANIKIMRAMVEAYCPRVLQCDNAVDRAAALVLDWNALIINAAQLCASAYHSYCVERLDVPGVRELLSLIDVSRSDAAIERALKDTDRRENAGRKVEHDVPISDPNIRKYVESLGGVPRAQRISVMPTYEHKSAEELVDLMSPELAEEINQYASRHGYPTVEVPQLALVS
ncbi:hypothetical protein LCGC14_1618860 [marine sediment metagenome]|uniref:Sulfotransferase domain-containing protein n=1 Tax=marine sediment metagenome TaxID=412755 RepID=A0A0F9I643_9ZZZZ